MWEDRFLVHSHVGGSHYILTIFDGPLKTHTTVDTPKNKLPHPYIHILPPLQKIPYASLLHASALIL